MVLQGGSVQEMELALFHDAMKDEAANVYAGLVAASWYTSTDFNTYVRYQIYLLPKL